MNKTTSLGTHVGKQFNGSARQAGRKNFEYFLCDWRGDLLSDKYVAVLNERNTSIIDAQLEKLNEQIGLIDHITPEAQEAWFSMQKPNRLEAATAMLRGMIDDLKDLRETERDATKDEARMFSEKFNFDNIEPIEF